MRFLLILFYCSDGSLAAQSCWPVVPVVQYRTVPVEILPMPRKADLPEAPPIKKESAKPPLMPKEEAFSTFVVERSAANRKEEGYRVRFFNHSDRDLLLEIEGQELKLGAGESARRKVPREFTWKEKGQPLQRQSIPVESLGIDVVIRW